MSFLVNQKVSATDSRIFEYHENELSISLANINLTFKTVLQDIDQKATNIMKGILVLRNAMQSRTNVCSIFNRFTHSFNID